MLSSKEVSSWLYILIGGSLIFTLLLITRGLDQMGKPQLPYEVRSLIDTAVNRERENIAKAMSDYPLVEGRQLADYQLEAGGQPVRAMVVTTWRSGSTFIGDIMASHPATYYHYEPLLHFDIRTARSGHLAEEGIRTLKNLMKCNYTNLNYYLQYGRSHHWLFLHNGPLWRYCTEARDFHHSYCWIPAFLNRFCPLFPFQSIKTVRLRLNLTQQFVEDDDLNVRILLLVRDPRGTMQSRKHRDWCPGNPDCDEPRLLCSDLVSDYHAFNRLNKQFPGRYKVFRYEDFSMDPFNNTVDLFNFFGYSMHDKVVSFLQTHTTSNIGGVSSTFRDSKTAPFAWRDKLTMEEVINIQESCEEAMRLWGYRKYQDQQEMEKLSPTEAPPSFYTDVQEEQKRRRRRRRGAGG